MATLSDLQLDPAVVDHLEFYLLNDFKPGIGKLSQDALKGQRTMERIGCTRCHVPNLTIRRDRRVADVETMFDPARGASQSALRDGNAALHAVH